MRQGGNKNIEEGKKTFRKENNKIVEEEGNKNEKGEGKYNILRSVKRKKKRWLAFQNLESNLFAII